MFHIETFSALGEDKAGHALAVLKGDFATPGVIPVEYLSVAGWKNVVAGEEIPLTEAFLQNKTDVREFLQAVLDVAWKRGLRPSEDEGAA